MSEAIYFNEAHNTTPKMYDVLLWFGWIKYQFIARILFNRTSEFLCIPLI